MEVLSQIGILPTVVALLYGLAAVIWGIDRLIRDVLNYRLAKKYGAEALPDVAKFVRAQQGRRRWPKPPQIPPPP
jgi:hypothetical protein